MAEVLLENVRIGVIQTAVDFRNAWHSQKVPKMSASEEEIAAREIQRGLSEFARYGPAPHIILLPELSIPRGLVSELESFAEGDPKPEK